MMNKRLQCVNIKKHYVEHYVSIKQHIQAHIEAVKKTVYTPFMSLTMNLIQTDMENKKLIRVKVTCILNGSIVSWNLAVTASNSTAQQMEGEKKASDLLLDWCKVDFKRIIIHPEKHVLTLCSDSGSHVKRALEVVFPTHREWNGASCTLLTWLLQMHLDPLQTHRKPVAQPSIFTLCEPLVIIFIISSIFSLLCCFVIVEHKFIIIIITVMLKIK